MITYSRCVRVYYLSENLPISLSTSTAPTWHRFAFWLYGGLCTTNWCAEKLVCQRRLCFCALYVTARSFTLKLSGSSFISTWRKISSIAFTMRPSLCCAVAAVFGGSSDEGDGIALDAVDMPARFGFGPSIVWVLPEPNDFNFEILNWFPVLAVGFWLTRCAIRKYCGTVAIQDVGYQRWRCCLINFVLCRMFGEDIIVCVFLRFVFAAIVEIQRFLWQNLNAFIVFQIVRWTHTNSNLIHKYKRKNDKCFVLGQLKLAFLNLTYHQAVFTDRYRMDCWRWTTATARWIMADHFLAKEKISHIYLVNEHTMQN